LLNVMSVLRIKDNITQKEISQIANVPQSTLSEKVIPLLEKRDMVERVSVGPGKLVRAIYE